MTIGDSFTFTDEDGREITVTERPLAELLAPASEELDVIVVPDIPCPTCGSCWGHPNPALDFPNRPKVEDEGVWWWRCYNPDCSTSYFDPMTGVGS